jgi:hypothetical protein
MDAAAFGLFGCPGLKALLDHLPVIDEPGDPWRVMLLKVLF